jgi:FlaA1/EpsC-like NDP-sugar epimerase
MVLHALETAWGGEIFVPKIPSYKITDIATAIGPNCEQKVVGIRPGEKIHEEMITSSDSFFTYDLGKYYAIIPQIPRWSIDKFILAFNAKKVEEGFTYNSGSNHEWVGVNELRELILKHVDKNFSI